MSYERPRIRAMRGYTSGEQPQRADAIKLNTNENPYPPSPRVAEALTTFDVATLRRYPQPTADAFRDVVAAKLGLGRGQILATNGGDELLRLAFTTFLDAGDTYGTTNPSYSLYPVLAAIQGCREFTVDLNRDWMMPADIARRFNDAGARMICIVNPHAPSGALTRRDALAAIARDFKGVVLIDEAYIDFVDPKLAHSTVDLVREFDNVLLLRSLSKGYSLAGLRLGFAIASASLIEPMLSKTRDSYNVDAIAQRLGCAAFSDTPYASNTWAMVRQERMRLSSALRDRGFEHPNSQTNFLLTTPPLSGPPAHSIHAALKERGILVRHFDIPRLADKLRITIGDPAQNTALLRAFDELIGHI